MSLPSWSEVERSARMLDLTPPERNILHKFYEAERRREQRFEILRPLLKFISAILLGALIVGAFMWARVLLP